MTQDGTADSDEASKVLSTLRISSMELYNEEARDLLSPQKEELLGYSPKKSGPMTASLSIQEDRSGNVVIPNITEKTVGSIDELMEVIQMAEENRTVGSTSVNERSSRSHTIYRITYEKREATKVDELPMGDESEDKENDNTPGRSSVKQRSSQKVVTTVSTLNLVDLAGSESVRVTGATGERQKEGGKINQR